MQFIFTDAYFFIPYHSNNTEKLMKRNRRKISYSLVIGAVVSRVKLDGNVKATNNFL